MWRERTVCSSRAAPTPRRAAQSGLTQQPVSEAASFCANTSVASSIAEAAQWAEVVFLAVPATAAVEVAKGLAAKAGFRTVDTGPLRNAALCENLAMLWIHLATVGGHGRNFVFAMQDQR